jgi:hypothetical protein
MRSAAPAPHARRPAPAAARFRFRPPRLAPSAALDWTLLRAFAPAEIEAGAPRAARALDLAERLSLLPRIAARSPAGRIAAELGEEGAERVRAARALALARELRFAEALAEIDRAASSVGAEPAVLKGRALVLAGWTAPGARPSQDLDLLVPARALGDLRRALCARGFREAGSGGYAHQLRPLCAPCGEIVELHRHLPGVRLAPRRFATWDDLARAGLLAPPPAGSGLDAVRIPGRELLATHALVHALAQHGLAARGPGWLLIGDLLDLGAHRDRVGAAPWPAWIERAASREEIAAALALAARAAAGERALAGDDCAGLLARHFTACALDADYAEALKARWLEAPLSERPLLAARLGLVARAFVPPAPGGRAPAGLRLADWLARPFDLARRAARAARAARRTAATRSARAGAAR